MRLVPRHALVGVLTLGVVLAGTAALPASAAPAPLPAVRVAVAAQQCALSLGPSLAAAGPADTAKAAAVMNGYADLGRYGHFTLAANPSWKPVSTLDASGKGHMHSLDYLLPLLRVGVAIGNTAMTNRFYALLQDWVHDNGPGAATRGLAWGPPIYEGFRALVLTCAAAGPRGSEPWLVKALVLHGQQMADPRRYEGVNNASLHQSMGLYAIGATLGNAGWQATAVARMRSLAVKLIHADGSDEEGSVGYAMSDYRWFKEAADRLRATGSAVPAELRRVDLVPAFIAAAARPDGHIEDLGDTSPTKLNAATWAGTAAQFPSTKGVSGVAPTSVFGAFQGGYAFGRSGWGTARTLADETYYSVRAGRFGGIPHAHDDVSALTLYAYGSPLLLDPGQWRYQYGTTRNFIVSHASHNAVVIPGLARRAQARPTMTASSVGGIDLVTVTDRGYRGVTITRTVAYDRVDDALLVWDRLTSATAVRASQQWGLGRDKEVTLVPDAVHTTGGGANVSLYLTSGGAPLDIAEGQRSPLRGWNSQAYAELSPAPSVRASQTGTSLQWLTVIVPRKAGVTAAGYGATSAVSGSAAAVLLSNRAGSALLRLDGTGATRAEAAPVAPAVLSAKPVLLAGTSTGVRATGLTPAAPAVLQVLPSGATDWAPAATATASAAGTAQWSVPVPVTTALRVVSGSAVSPPVAVTAAVAPAAPAPVAVASTGHGTLTVGWTPPASDGGTPVTGYSVTVDGRRTQVPAGATALPVTGLRAGPHTVSVTATNAVATSPAASAAAVVVPAYPTLRAPATVVIGKPAVVTLSGLLPGAPVDATITPTRVGGLPVVVHLLATAAGTAVLRFPLAEAVTVTATSGGVTSATVVVRAVPAPKRR